MAIETHPRPDNIPQRPRLTARVLADLRGVPDDDRYPSPRANALDWLAAMRTWAAWAFDYCERLDAAYVEHQAIAHDRRVEPGELADVGLMYGGGAAPLERCKVCAYLYEQYEANQL